MRSGNIGPLAQPGPQVASNVRTSSCSSGYYTESNNVTRESLNCEHIKCVLLGDGAVGKTSMIISYTTNGYPSDYTPTTFDTFKVEVKVEDKPVHLEICDTAGQEDFDGLRPLCYSQADVFLLCFSVISPSSLGNVKSKWISEVRKYGPTTVPVVLVGTQVDLRDDVKISIDLAEAGEKPVTEAQANDFAKLINAVSYVECSALTSKNLKTVFDTALLAAIDYQIERESHTNRFSHLKQHSSLISGARFFGMAPKKRSQSASSSAAGADTNGKFSETKLCAPSSNTSPSILGAVLDSDLKSKCALRTEGKFSTAKKCEQEEFVCQNALPPSPPTSRQRRSRCLCF